MNQVFLGDNLEVLKSIKDCSIDSVVTDPPYGLSFMGKKWDCDVPSVELWSECLRVLKPGGHLLAFAGTRTQHRMAVRIEDAGFEIRDMIAWVYGSGFPKSMDVSKAIDRAGISARQWQGWGTALKPAMEPITVARKPLEGTVAANVLKHGTGAVNIDECRINANGEKLCGGNNSSATDLTGKHEGWARPWMKDESSRIAAAERSKSATEKAEALGRWPANFIHDGSDEVVEMFPQSKSTGGQSSLGAFRNGDVYGKGKDERWIDDPGYGDSGSAARFFYCAKASKKDRNEGCEGLEKKVSARSCQAQAEAKRGNVVECESGAFNKARLVKNNHPTVKPTDLMRYLCRLVTPPGGVVLDPFMGSGSTGKASVMEGFCFVGVEIDPEYFEIAKARIDSARKQCKCSFSQQEFDFGIAT